MIGIVPGKESSEYRVTRYAALAGAALVVAGVTLAAFGLVAAGAIAGGAGCIGSSSVLVAYIASRARVKGQVGAARVPKARVGI